MLFAPAVYVFYRCVVKRGAVDLCAVPVGIVLEEAVLYGYRAVIPYPERICDVYPAFVGGVELLFQCEEIFAQGVGVAAEGAFDLRFCLTAGAVRDHSEADDCRQRGDESIPTLFLLFEAAGEQLHRKSGEDAGEFTVNRSFFCRLPRKAGGDLVCAYPDRAGDAGEHRAHRECKAEYGGYLFFHGFYFLSLRIVGWLHILQTQNRGEMFHFFRKFFGFFKVSPPFSAGGLFLDKSEAAASLCRYTAS